MLRETSADIATPTSTARHPYDGSMVPEGYRSLLRRGRNRLRIEAQDTWDRFVSSDSGLARLFKGLRAVAAVGTTIVVQLLVAMAIGVEGQTRLLHLMLGALIAMNLSTLVRPGRRRELVRAGVWAPIAASLGAAVAIVTAPITVAGPGDSS